MAESPKDLAGSLQRFGLARDRMRAALAKKTGIGSADLDAMEYLEAEGPLTQRDLGQRLSLTSGAITMLVDRLEHAGWVTRRPHPTDRRYTLIELAPPAVEAAPPELDDYHRAIRDLADSVPARSRAVIAGFLNQAAAAASQGARDLGSGPNLTPVNPRRQ
ncbi:MAG TPA: MarR family transcriptional regulator [Acidimicrobiales bacterium]|nr:MarR family transcriptional regulator [Acidimicrobiales bacterium]